MFPHRTHLTRVRAEYIVEIVDLRRFASRRSMMLRRFGHRYAPAGLFHTDDILTARGPLQLVHGANANDDAHILDLDDCLVDDGGRCVVSRLHWAKPPKSKNQKNTHKFHWFFLIKQKYLIKLTGIFSCDERLKINQSKWGTSGEEDASNFVFYVVSWERRCPGGRRFDFVWGRNSVWWISKEATKKNDDNHQHNSKKQTKHATQMQNMYVQFDVESNNNDRRAADTTNPISQLTFRSCVWENAAAYNGIQLGWTGGGDLYWTCIWLK